MKKRSELSPAIKVLRWLALAPAVILSVPLVAFPVHWVVVLIQLFGQARDDSMISIDGKTPLAAIPPEIMERFAYVFFFPLMMVYVAYRVAPSRKFSAAIAVAIVWGMIFGGAATYSLSNAIVSWGHALCATALGCAGVATGLFTVYKKKQSEEPECQQEVGQAL